MKFIKSQYLKLKLSIWARLNLPKFLKIADTEMVIPARNWMVAITARIETTRIEGGRMWYEPEELGAFADFFKGGETFWDAGSNIGYYLLFAAGHGAKEVVGFDVIKEFVDFSNKCLRLNKIKGQIYHCALSSEAGPRQKFSYSFLESECGSDSLDGFLNGGLPGPDVLKMDIEGAEAEAIIGAGDVFRRYHPRLNLSTHDAFLKKFGSSSELVVDDIKKRGYREVSTFGETHYFYPTEI